MLSRMRATPTARQEEGIITDYLGTRSRGLSIISPVYSYCDKLSSHFDRPNEFTVMWFFGLHFFNFECNANYFLGFDILEHVTNIWINTGRCANVCLTRETSTLFKKYVFGIVREKIYAILSPVHYLTSFDTILLLYKRYRPLDSLRLTIPHLYKYWGTYYWNNLTLILA